MSLLRALRYAAFAVTPIAPLFAQVSAPRDSLPFRKGQWAAQFTASSEHRNAGILRFRSPRSAWVLTANVGAGSANGKGTEMYPWDTVSRPSTDDSDQVGFSARAGRRQYRALTLQAASFASYGALGGVSRSHSKGVTDGFSRSTRHMQWHAGLFGEIGAAYLIVPNVSLGVIGSVEGRFARGRNFYGTLDRGRTYTTSSTSNAFRVSTEILSAVLTVYF